MLRITPRKSLELASKIRTKMKKEWGKEHERTYTQQLIRDGPSDGSKGNWRRDS